MTSSAGAWPAVSDWTVVGGNGGFTDKDSGTGLEGETPGFHCRTGLEEGTTGWLRLGVSGL